MTETRRLPVTPEREHFHVDALAYVGPDPSNPENALFVSPGGIPFLLAIKENSQTLAGWMPDKRIAILYGTQIMTRRIDDILVTSIEQDDVIAMMHLVDESTLPSDHRERALRILADLSAGLKPEPLKLTRGTEEELDQVMADLADYFECAFNLYSATAEDGIAVDEDGIGPTALPIVLAAGNWFLPVGSNPCDHYRFVENRTRVTVGQYIAEPMSAHERLEAAHRLRTFFARIAEPELLNTLRNAGLAD